MSGLWARNPLYPLTWKISFDDGPSELDRV